MPNSRDHIVSRRVVLGGAAAGVAGVAGAWLAPGSPAHAAGGLPPGTIDRVVSRLDGELIELRRALHRRPEVAGQEAWTAATVAQRLREAGLDVTTGVGGHGVVGILTGARRGRTVAYRADMDAVPPGEQSGGGTEPAHVCGHDVHTTVGVGVALTLARLRERLAGTVMFVFQPAEETLEGAAAMLADGVFARGRPAEIHALHCGPFPVGQILPAPGTGLPGLDRGLITLDSADAAQHLAAELTALSTVSRPMTPADLERLVADIQTPHGPLSRFVFLNAQAIEAQVRVSYRCWPENRWPEIRRQIHRLARSAGNATVSFPNDPFPAMITPEREGRALRRYLRRTIGDDRTPTQYAAIPFNGEDFSLFLDRVPGTYSFLGVRAPGAPIENSAPHFSTFDPDERAIGHGVRAMAGWLSTRTQP